MHICIYEKSAMTKIAVIILSFILTLELHSQNGRLYTTDHELHNSYVNQVCQDKSGYIWIASRGGLLRYDGYSFKTYRNDGKKGDLMSNYVNCLCANNHGRLFVGTSVGVMEYNYNLDCFSKVPMTHGDIQQEQFNTISFFRCLNDDILVTSTGFGIYRIKSGSNNGELIEGFPFSGNIKSIAESKDGEIWGASDDCGVAYMFKGKTKTYLTDRALELGCNNVVILDDGIAYIGTFHDGVYKFDKQSDSFKHIPSTSGLPIFSMALSNDGLLVIGTDGLGIYEYNPNDGSFRPSSIHSRDVDFSKGKISSIMYDHDGNMWLGLLQKGVFLSPHRKSAFHYIGHKSDEYNLIGNCCVNSLLTDRSGVLWVGTDGDGIYSISKNGNVRHYSPPEVPATIMCVTEDKDGDIWIGSYLDGGGRLDRNTGNYYKLPCTEIGDAQHVYGLQFDDSGNIWIATLGDGLKCYNPVSNELMEWKMSPGATLQTNSLPNKWTRFIYFSSDKTRAYICSSPGLACLDLNHYSYTTAWGKNMLLNDYQSYCVIENPDGTIYVGTDNGLYHISHDGNIISHVSTEDGLPDNSVFSILTDRKGNHWLSTGHGLVKYNIQSGTIQNYYATDGIQGNEFSERAACYSDGGMMLFGGTEGVSMFCPDSLNMNITEMRIFMTDFKVGNTHISQGMKSGGFTITDKGINDSDVFHLSHNDNSISICFSSMEYVAQEGIQFLYSLNEGEWTSLEAGKNELSLSHLAPGDYRFRVKAVRLGEIESDIHAFRIIIHPPWYATTTAYILYFLLFVLSSALYLRHKRRQEQMRLRLQEHIHTEQLHEAQAKMAEATAKEAEARTQMIENIGIDKVQSDSPDEKLLSRIIACINKNVANSEYNVEMIAQEVGLSRVHLYRKMKELTGQSPSSFISEVRLSNAARMLSEHNQSVEEVAFACGFNSPSSFSRKFKQFYGKPPSDFCKFQGHDSISK